MTPPPLPEPPVEIRRARLATATFAVDHPPAARLVGPTGLELLQLPFGKALAAVVFVRYGDTDLGAYNEVGLCLMVRDDKGKPGAYVHRLPVDQEFTMRAGRDLWGFPKWMTEITTTFDQKGASCSLSDGGDFVLAMHARRSHLPLPGRELTMDAWTHRDGVLRRTPWVMRHRGIRARLGGTTLVIGDSNPMADELRALGLPRRALMTTVVDAVSGRFEAAVDESRASAAVPRSPRR